MNLLLWTALAFAANDHGWQPIKLSQSAAGVRVSGRVVAQDGGLNIESARVPGRVITILKREGEHIVPGTALYEISSAECFSLAEERRVAQSKNLPELLEGVKRRERQLGLRLEGDSCKIVADKAGVLTKRSLESGAAFNVGDAVATTLDTKRMTVEIEVPEKDQARVREGQDVRLQFASDPDNTYDAKVQSTVPAIDPATRTMRARLKPLKLPGNVSLDALVFGDIQTGTGDAMLNVPTASLVFHRNQQFVVAGGEEKPLAIPVYVVNENESQTAIRPLRAGSLKEGDLVATRGAIFLFRKLAGDVTP